MYQYNRQKITPAEGEASSPSSCRWLLPKFLWAIPAPPRRAAPLGWRACRRINRIATRVKCDQSAPASRSRLGANRGETFSEVSAAVHVREKVTKEIAFENAHLAYSRKGPPVSLSMHLMRLLRYCTHERAHVNKTPQTGAAPAPGTGSPAPTPAEAAPAVSRGAPLCRLPILCPHVLLQAMLTAMPPPTPTHTMAAIPRK